MSLFHSVLNPQIKKPIRARLTAPKAVIPKAHKLARIFYHLWESGNSYIDLGMDACEQQHRERVIKNLKKKR